jgi:hypothetical protein
MALTVDRPAVPVIGNLATAGAGAVEAASICQSRRLRNHATRPRLSCLRENDHKQVRSANQVPSVNGLEWPLGTGDLA